MNNHEQDHGTDIPRDPLGLSGLPMLQPGHDDWAQIRAALADDTPATVGQRRRPAMVWAIAASVVVAVGLLVTRMPNAPTPVVDEAAIAASPDAPQTQDLVAMSQLLELRLRQLRANSGALPAQSVLWVTELEDMIARVDGELTMAPESVELWGQRVNLLLDLESIYVHQFEREYGRMASL
ncbi:hypothetical protein F3N42_07015 [Marinihelvus fidelis]|uniref:Uncharacterized protein n=1 Tax=Marinihelvus fidelis TaxID=2613842 RepID=A0A5N0TF86_9GAMM|nr:hypothetical protein [Marinihelvus fidelis]KAA9131919.1 hypothetical protein F3N42_07015 [Marinihelvus fidelis]